MGPAHSEHEQIRREGRGRFSHWQAGLYFSSSDGSDPSANGRVYRIEAKARVRAWIPVSVLALMCAFLFVRHFRSIAWRRNPSLWSLAHIAMAAVPVLVVALAVLAAFRWAGGNVVAVRAPSIEHALVDAQLARTSAGPMPRIAFVGDSSCLMGIDAPGLSRRLGKQVENYCTIGYVGPAGYARMVDDLARHPRTGGAALVIAIHGVQFEREPGWQRWQDYVSTAGASERQTVDFFTAARFATWSALDPLAFSTLPGAYGRHYGSESAVRRAVARGDVVDAADRNMDKRAIVPPFVVDGVDAMLVQGQPPAAVPDGFRFRINDAFRASAATLRESIRKLGVRTYVMVTPIPAHLEDVVTRTQREAAAAELVALLGLPPEALLATPATLPQELFASTTHLAPRGRVVFSEILAARLPPS